MSEKLLYDLHVLAVGLQESRVGRAEDLPRHSLCDPQSLRRGLNVILHELGEPQRLLPAFLSGARCITSEDPVAVFLVWRNLVPCVEIGGRVWIQRYGASRSLRLPVADPLIHVPADDIDLMVLKINIAPLQALDLAST